MVEVQSIYQKYSSFLFYLVVVFLKKTERLIITYIEKKMAPLWQFNSKDRDPGELSKTAESP